MPLWPRWRSSQTLDGGPDVLSDYLPRIPEASLQKFLPFNHGGEDSDSDADPYSSDHFRMFEFKVRRCTRSRSHDWTDCPFAHPGEKARRRDPRKYHYSGTVCAEYRRGSCSRGDNCEFAHGVFECWLHPSKYRTEACKDGKNCKRKVCFFAHSARQLRLLPGQSEPDSPQEINPDKSQFRSPVPSSSLPRCCLFCHSVTASSSPTSTLLGMSHLSPPLSPSQSLSPPLSPLKGRSLGGFSPISRYSDRLEPSCLSQGMSYKDVLNEIMTSLDMMKMSSEVSPPHPLTLSSVKNQTATPWVDVTSGANEEQTQFILSPSGPNPPQVPRNFFGGDCLSNRGGLFGDKVSEGNSCDDPDIGWVNELLM
ncbi:zinc finger CCCH domain-containing protein 2-like [Rhodamnia argentea]|uniref:Zinc finger CCCH domain-containing protein 2-like n=1 Tax=Rhodamnia argentea TaxID=178133 RepID=A0A8B8NDF0_9MYRT|nr:zinc finger CCCH domain-containing protein 2-like [Rhodamnia argentea]